MAWCQVRGLRQTRLSPHQTSQLQMKCRQATVLQTPSPRPGGPSNSPGSPVSRTWMRNGEIYFNPKCPDSWWQSCKGQSMINKSMKSVWVVWIADYSWSHQTEAGLAGCSLSVDAVPDCGRKTIWSSVSVSRVQLSDLKAAAGPAAAVSHLKHHPLQTCQSGLTM